MKHQKCPVVDLRRFRGNARYEVMWYTSNLLYKDTGVGWIKSVGPDGDSYAPRVPLGWGRETKAIPLNALYFTILHND